MVTGHRNLPDDKVDCITERIRQEVLQAITEGYTHFISGFAQGSDLIFAPIIVDLQKIYSITLEAALPYRNRIQCKDAEFHRLLANCNLINVHSEEYSPNCFLIRNQIMVQLCSRVIAVYDGRRNGGTVATMRYAHTLKRDIHIIEI